MDPDAFSLAERISFCFIYLMKNTVDDNARKFKYDCSLKEFVRW